MESPSPMNVTQLGYYLLTWLLLSTLSLTPNFSCAFHQTTPPSQTFLFLSFLFSQTSLHREKGVCHSVSRHSLQHSITSSLIVVPHKVCQEFEVHHWPPNKVSSPHFWPYVIQIVVQLLVISYVVFSDILLTGLPKCAIKYLDMIHAAACLILIRQKWLLVAFCFQCLFLDLATFLGCLLE